MPRIKTGGRTLGTPNKNSAWLKEVAQVYSEQALITLSKIMHNQKAPAAARVQAAQVLLDRGFGKPHQTQDIAVTETQHYVRAPSKSSDSEWKRFLERKRSEPETIARELRATEPKPSLTDRSNRPAASPRTPNLAGVNKIN